ncbi:hypothetical protein QPK87_22370 [Kamptonema cortianum]|uniref:Uncharacterized protein n=1 Tax=Geitlerinema calcuttense NRMC-F 0142 TaxID=2922238 RepID=A0ABT7LZL0_9CYAN|nr:hypothetical protein [Geitlerinema calcuttense]MDI9640832.1 hypothetical protein [Geitlerinema splendidum]MDK3159296.1 hypothetical protein [Kamptonema cortianum]MDL5051681.1 hypothetical protein [Oscillatoria amoena NRMC-F 0135]MDL5056820.1 hypothetical protein [Geitlerinema calcuttense NRMC-F 0142]
MDRRLQPLNIHSKIHLEAHEEQLERFRSIKVLKLKIKWMEALTQQAQTQLQELEQDPSPDVGLMDGELDAILPHSDLHPLEEPTPDDLGL